MSKILVIEDEPELSGIICDFLINEGFQVLQSFDGGEGLAAAREASPDLVILDINLPHLSGVEICRGIRTWSHAPIIMISARSSDTDKLRTLGMGADDYLTKPFSMAELVARVKSHLRRYLSFESRSGPEDTPAAVTCGEMMIDRGARRVTVSGAEIPLTAREFELLFLLAGHPSQVFSKEQIMNQVWGYDEYLDENTVAVYVGRLREKLSRADICGIKTVWGMGYKWEP